MYGRSQNFLKNNTKGLLYSIHSVLFFWVYYLKFAKRKWQIHSIRKNYNIQFFDFPTILSWSPSMPLHPWRSLLSFPDQVTGHRYYPKVEKFSPLYYLYPVSSSIIINNFQGALPERDGHGKVVRKLNLKCFPYETCSAVQRHKIPSK